MGLSLWGGGIRLARRQLDYLTVCARFDRGLVAFFIILLAKFLILPQAGVKVEGKAFEFLIFSFFLCSLLAIGLVRNSATAAERDFLPGYRGIGVILGFTVVLLLLCAGVAFFCLPYLTRAAETSYVLLKGAARPVGSLLLMILRFIFGSPEDWKSKVPKKEAAQVPKFDTSGQHSWWVEFLGQILVWVGWTIFALTLLVIVGGVLYFFVQWLFSKTERDEPGAPLRPLPFWAEQVKRFSLWLRDRFRRMLTSGRGIIPIFAALQRWGSHSGLPHVKSETPAEYGLRLKSRFPLLAREIETIILAFNEQVYGGIFSTEQRLAMAASAWVRLRSPLFWPRRLKSWFFRHQEEDGPLP